MFLNTVFIKKKKKNKSFVKTLASLFFNFSFYIIWSMVAPNDTKRFI